MKMDLSFSQLQKCLNFYTGIPATPSEVWLVMVGDWHGATEVGHPDHQLMILDKQLAWTLEESQYKASK